MRRRGRKTIDQAQDCLRHNPPIFSLFLQEVHDFLSLLSPLAPELVETETEILEHLFLPAKRFVLPEQFLPAG